MPSAHYTSLHPNSSRYLAWHKPIASFFYCKSLSFRRNSLCNGRGFLGSCKRVAAQKMIIYRTITWQRQVESKSVNINGVLLQTSWSDVYAAKDLNSSNFIWSAAFGWPRIWLSNQSLEGSHGPEWCLQYLLHSVKPLAWSAIVKVGAGPPSVVAGTITTMYLFHKVKLL